MYEYIAVVITRIILQERWQSFDAPNLTYLQRNELESLKHQRNVRNSFKMPTTRISLAISFFLNFYVLITFYGILCVSFYKYPYEEIITGQAENMYLEFWICCTFPIIFKPNCSGFNKFCRLLNRRVGIQFVLKSSNFNNSFDVTSFAYRAGIAYFS